MRRRLTVRIHDLTIRVLPVEPVQSDRNNDDAIARG